jgi:hypothetical protein
MPSAMEACRETTHTENAALDASCKRSLRASRFAVRASFDMDALAVFMAQHLARLPLQHQVLRLALRPARQLFRP